ncbi:hypothetical protein CN321_17905 [Bacillus thuringiensis]|nr:hypothetical protein CN400_16750 [Bacillus thuringiensis]PFE91142.1 hypothetical protein CN321_17905 [Bacillus thuringiensis]PFV48471.1 hypothetical protein COL14_18400 [Bacillus thuringiensis]
MFAITMTTNNKTFTFSMMSISTRIIIMFVFPPVVMILTFTRTTTMFPPVVMILAFTRMTTMFPTVITPTHFYTSSQTRVILFYVLIEKMLV